jgi:hypothetical protein
MAAPHAQALRKGPRTARETSPLPSAAEERADVYARHRRDRRRHRERGGEGGGLAHALAPPARPGRLADAARERRPRRGLSGRQHARPLGGGRGARLPGWPLGHLPAMGCHRRPGPKGRARRHRRVLALPGRGEGGRRGRGRGGGGCPARPLGARLRRLQRRPGGRATLPASTAPALPEAARIAEAEAFFAALPGLDLRHGGNAAFYSPSTDHVQMPPFADFRTGEGYYATLAHEAAHWTGHPSRLARDLTGRFGGGAWRPSRARTTPATSRTGSGCCGATGGRSSPPPARPRPRRTG